MKKRAVVSFCVLICFTLAMTFRVLYLTEGEELAQAAQNQSTYRLDVAKARGTIYDCNKIPLTNESTVWKAAVMPTPRALTILQEVLGQEASKTIIDRLKTGKPVAVNLPQNISDCDGIYSFETPVHYASEQLAAHLIGYLGSDRHGISGIEKAYDEWLGGDYAASVKYKVDAVGRVLTGESVEIDDTLTAARKGVVLTIDSRLQEIAERVAKEQLKTGAVVITEVATGKIRALVSTPGFSPATLSESMEGENAPMLNRAFTAYNVGSVFKLVAAQAAIEKGVHLEYLCTGTTEYAQHTFQCIGATAHGQVTMEKAIANSCNCYFIHLSEMIGAEALLSTAQKMGFGEETLFAPGIVSAKGQLPTLRSLVAPAALANFSFGQGDLMATPIQITRLINTIAANGICRELTLVEGLMDGNGQITPIENTAEPKETMSMSTAIQLQQYMVSAVQNGTAYTGCPSSGGAGAKTATAETGWIQDGHSVIQAWYAGYFPTEVPKYTMVILAEDGGTGSGTCGPIFRQIANEINALEQ